MTRKPAAPKGDTARVRMLAVISGAEPQINPGDVIEVDSDEAARLVEIGAAAPADEQT